MQCLQVLSGNMTECPLRRGSAYERFIKMQCFYFLGA